MNAMRPAEVSVPGHIQTLLVVDRTKIRQRELGVVEGLLTGELPGQDKAAVQAGIRALQSTMRASPRFAVKVAPERLTGNSLTMAFPDPLRWEEIDQLVQQYQADAVLAIELFDSDFVVTNGVRRVTKRIAEGSKTVEVEVEEYFASGVCDVRMGFRLYDPRQRSIIDQRIYPHSGFWEAVGGSPQEALGLLISNAEATGASSEGAAVDYAGRIAPMPVRISRKFYSKSKKAPAISGGSRMADVGQWEEAARTWEAAIPASPPKEAGYLAYNVAIANEVLGDLDAAVAWAQASYVDYGNKDARDYVQLLRSRIRRENLLQEQLRARAAGSGSRPGSRR
jgi:hypothetical protein